MQLSTFGLDEVSLDLDKLGSNSKFIQNTHALRNIETPTLVLWGDEDAWISHHDAEKFKNDLKNVTVKIYEGVGHIPMEEIPELTANDVLNFLKK